MAKLRPEVAAQVAAQLTQARMALMGGVFAGRPQGTQVQLSGRIVEETFRYFLAMATDLDPKSVEAGATLDLMHSAIIPEAGPK